MRASTANELNCGGGDSDDDDDDYDNDSIGCIYLHIQIHPQTAQRTNNAVEHTL